MGRLSKGGEAGAGDFVRSTALEVGTRLPKQNHRNSDPAFGELGCFGRAKRELVLHRTPTVCHPEKNSGGKLRGMPF